jgi:hypothetical protein
MEQERGKEARLECIVEGYPRGNVTWWYKGKQLKRDYRTTFSVYDITSHTARYSITISGLEFDDFGVYTCKASNNAGTAQGQTELSQRASGKLIDGTAQGQIELSQRASSKLIDGTAQVSL